MSKLFVFAHQDDEVAIATRIAREVAAGARVVCAFLTDGGAPQVRDAESRAALQELGVHELIFVGLPDGKLVEHLEEAYRAIEAIDAGEVMTLAWEGGHQDHDAAHLVALALAIARGVRCLEFPLYHGKGLWGPFFHVMKPLHGGQRRRLSAREVWRRTRLCWRYPSQWRSWIGLCWPTLLRWNEVVCDASAERVLHPPHEGRLLYERRFRFPRERFFAAAGPFIEKRIVERTAVHRLARD
ncbi:MAG TPA: PIG-L family deacetylase [Thermoanaerobaculia bacterium]|nr:PIG-L family deacetylase [Thermoanaerobaculia bacterium]